MNEFEATRKFWRNEIVRGNLMWPDEHVIRFVKRNFSPEKVILDYGCGAGRNSVALAQEGYQMVAMDYTDEAIHLVESKAGGLNISVVKNDGFNVPLEPGSIDGIIAVGSLFCNKKRENAQILSNLKNVLKPDGKIWVNWRTTRDSLCHEGEYLGEGLYKLGKGTGREGCSYFFCDEKDLTDMYEEAGLLIESIDDFEYTEKNRKVRCSYFHVISRFCTRNE